MPITVSLPSRDVELEFPDSMTEQEIQAAIDQEYPRSGEDVAFEVEQAKAQSIEGGNLVNPFQDMSRDDYILFRQNLANKKTSLGDFLGIAKDTFSNVIDEIGTGLGTAAYTTAQGEFGKVAESVGEGIVAGTIGLADIASKILKPANKIPSKEEFLKTQIPTEMVSRDTGTGLVGRMPQIVKRPATEADYNALIEQEKQRDVDAINRLYAIEATLKGAPVEEIARGAQNIDPAILTGLGSAAVRSLATKLAGKSIFKPVATAAARTATAPGGLGQAALSGIERAASGVQTAASLPSQALQGIRNVAERVAPGTGAAAQGTALATGLMADMGVTAGTLAGAATAEKAAEVVGAAARAARKEASRVGLLEQAAQDAAISPAARKLAGGLAQLQPVFRGASQAAAQALKEGAAGAAVGAGLGYLAERNLEGAAQGAGAGAAFGGLTGTMRSVFDMGREMVGGSTSRTRQQAAGDLNTFLAERPEVEQAAWSQTINRLVEQVGPERAAAQVDAMKIAEANGAKVRVATPDEMKQWQNPGWLDVSTQEVVLNPNKILGDTAAHETSHVLFSSAINRAFKPEIEQAIFGLADPVTGEIVRPGLFDDIALAKVADQIGDSYGNNTQAANEFKGYANVLRNTTDAAALQEARTRIADEMSAAYTGNLFGRLRPGRFNPDRLPLVYRNALNALEDSILDKFRSVLFEKGMDLGFDSVTRTFKDAKGKPIRIPELDAIVKRALAKRGTKAAQAPTAKPDLIPVNPADRAIWARSYGGARGILNDDNTPKTAAQIQAEATARWQDMTQRMAALPETERKGIEFNRDKTGKTVMTAKGQLSPEALNVILDSGTLDPSAKAVLRDVLTSMQNFNKATFDTRYYGVYDRGRGGSKMVAGVKSVSQNEILPYSVEMNSKEGVIIRAVDMTKVRDRLATALTKPQFKDVYASSEAALKDFNLYLENITQINPVDSATLLGGGEKGAKKRNLFYEALGFRLRNNESLLNAPESVISKSQNTVKSYRVERFAKLQDSGNRFAFEEATTYERAMKNFQPDAFARETLPAGETLTNPDGYRILKKAGSKLYRVYDDQGELIGTTSTEKAAMRKGQDDFAKKASREEPATIRFQFAGESAELPQFMRDSLEAAKAMAKEGKTSEVIRAITGWFPGKYDDKMRWEVPDEKAIIKGTVKADELVFRAWKNATQPRQPDAPTAELQDILRHPDLFNAYPEAARIPIVADVNLSSSGSIGPMAGFEGNVIRVNGTLSGERLKSTLLHEVQHWIQDKEGFARGSNLSEATGVLKGFKDASDFYNTLNDLELRITELSKASNEAYNRAKQIVREKGYGDEASALYDESERIEREAQPLRDKVKTLRTVDYRDAFDAYTRVAGEIEARDVQARQSFTPEQRKAIAPYSSENIAREEAIVLKSAKKASQEERQTRFQPVSPEQGSLTEAEAEIKSMLPSDVRADYQKFDNRAPILWRGETKFPAVRSVKIIGADASGKSRSIYPSAAVMLANGGVFVKRFRVSDHAQVSETAFRQYDLDYRLTRERGETERAFDKRIVDAAQNDLIDAARFAWEDQMNQLRPLVDAEYGNELQRQKATQRREFEIARQIDDTMRFFRDNTMRPAKVYQNKFGWTYRDGILKDAQGQELGQFANLDTARLWIRNKYFTSSSAEGVQLSAYPDIRFQPSSLTARDINAIAKEVGGGEVKGGAKKFGAFMREMRDKGITIRDVVKSYSITLSSIQRQELLAQTIKKNWPDAPFKDGEKIRPEDAFATLLGTKEGQEYLNSAEIGEFNEPAADVMMQKFKSFGFQNKLKEQMKIAAQEFFPKAQSIIDAVNNMPAEQFAEFVRSNVRGISYGKIGFWSGHLGRGDIPTFDSRMGKLVYGKEVPVSKKVLMDQKERLLMLGISVPDEFKDFAQTLLHHEVWDRLNQSDTEHAPIKEAMIRFQPDPLSPNIMVGSNGTRIIKSPSGKFRVYSVTGTLLGIRDTEQAAKKLATK